MQRIGCFRCGDLDHWRDACPLRLAAKTLAEHERRRQLYIDRYVENLISLDYKRELIAEERDLWRNRQERKSA